MANKIGRLGEQYAIDSLQSFDLNIPREYSVVRQSMSFDDVGFEECGFGFYLVGSTDAISDILRKQSREYMKNRNVPYVYIRCTDDTDKSGFYGIRDYSVSQGTGDAAHRNILGSFSALYGGSLATHKAGLQLNKTTRTTDYAVTPQSLHGFPYGAVVTPLTTLTRTGKDGVVSVVKDATHQTLHTYEQEEADMNKGDVTVYDTMNDADEDNWVEVLGCGHAFTGEIVIDNGIIRAKTRVDKGSLKGRVDVNYWETSAWGSAGQYYLNDITNTIDYGAETPKVHLKKVSSEECQLVLTYPAHANTPQLVMSLARGRRDITCQVTFITGTAPADFKATWVPATPMRYAYGDAEHDGYAEALGDHAVAVTTNNFLVAYDSKTTYFSGLAIVDLTSVDSKATVARSYSATEQAITYDTSYPVYGSEQAAQSFTPATSYSMTVISLRLAKTGTPPNDLTVDICSDSGGDPDTVLGTIAITAAELATSAAWIEKALSSAIPLTADTPYWIVLRTTLGDDENDYLWSIKSSGTYAGGHMEISADGGSIWSEFGGYDATFKVGYDETQIWVVKVRVADYYHSVFAVKYEDANIDDPEDLGAQLLYDTKVLPQVVER